MALVDFRSQLRAAKSVPDLARLLGAACMEEERELGWMRIDEQTEKDLERVELGAAAVPLSTWEGVIEDPSTWEEALGAKLSGLIKDLKARQPLDFLGVVRGLCGAPLEEVFATTREAIALDKGFPVRFATRPLKFEPTSRQEVLNQDLLSPYPYSLFPFSKEEQPGVVLDFAHRERLDELTWSKKDGLSPIATIHPPNGGEVDYKRSGKKGFFDVRPKEWDPDGVLSLLASVRGKATIAVLPELSLPTPRELESELRENRDAYPPIVIAGSAHYRRRSRRDGNELRINESRVYLDGECVATAQKKHCFEMAKTPEGERLEEPLREDLTREPKRIVVLSGARTRLAVAICADAFDPQITQRLASAGVNLLLVPAMTWKSGSFGPSLLNLAGSCQGVGMVTNARFGADGKPFLCYAAVPRPVPAEALAPLTADGASPPPRIGVFDPNHPLPGAVEWLQDA